MSENETPPRSRKFYRVTLAVLLLVAVAWNLYHVLRPGESLFAPAPERRVTATQPEQKGPLVVSMMPALHSGPGWRGEVRVEKDGDGSKITVYSVTTYGNPGPLESFQIWMTDAEGKEQDITASFTSNAKEELTGTLQNHGRVPLRVRLHRKESSLEFTQILDLP